MFRVEGLGFRCLAFYDPYEQGGGKGGGEGGGKGGGGEGGGGEGGS